MVHLKNGMVLKGTAYTLDPEKGGFHFINHGKGADAEVTIKYADVKYVAIVDNFTGERRKSPGEYQPKGSEVLVVFRDGERIDGYTLKQYNERLPRFPVIPNDPNDNRFSILVERSAVEHMALGRIPKTQELRKLVANAVRRLILHFYWEHPNVAVTLSDMAVRLQRTPSAIKRELNVFIEEGLVKLSGDGAHAKLKFSPAGDAMVREAINKMASEIDMLYFRKRKETPAPPPRGPVGRIHGRPR
jgi:hypothetical protein